MDSPIINLNPLFLEKIYERTKRHEGLRLEEYNCSEGHPTIGYGHKILPEDHDKMKLKGESFHITEEQANKFLHDDLMEALIDCGELINENQCRGKLTDNQEAVIFDMVFNMGKTGVSRFKKMWQALRDGDISKAADELLDSRYAKQVPTRAIQNAELLKADHQIGEIEKRIKSILMNGEG